jgi:low temperature requirement protein LtrA
VVNFFDNTYAAGLSFYIASRFSTAAWLLFVAILTPLIRPTLLYHAIMTILSSVLWIASIHIAYPSNLGLIFVAVCIDLFGTNSVIPLLRILRAKYPSINIYDKFFNYLPGINIEHRVERTGAFVSLVFGYSVIRILFQSKADFPLNDFLGKGILALIQAFVFNWIYFEIDAWGVHVHAIRRHWVTTFTWSVAHLPFAVSFILAASTLSELVIAHDSANTNTEWLGEGYEAASKGEIEPSLRWFYCGGLGVAVGTSFASIRCY